jgi:NAD(P) transhydrogenase subunit alpha
MKNSQRTNEGAVENIKHQTPNTKHQSDERTERVLGIGAWSFFGVWSLGFGVFAALFSQTSATAAEVTEATHASDTSFDFISALFVFMLATFIGLEVVRRVSRLLHTPLMSLTNAISAIAVVGAILVAGPEHPAFIHLLGLVAVVASVTNIVSGFLITDRMLKMFKKKPTPDPSQEVNRAEPQ